MEEPTIAEVEASSSLDKPANRGRWASVGVRSGVEVVSSGWEFEAGRLHPDIVMEELVTSILANWAPVFASLKRPQKSFALQSNFPTGKLCGEVVQLHFSCKISNMGIQ